MLPDTETSTVLPQKGEGAMHRQPAFLREQAARCFRLAARAREPDIAAELHSIAQASADKAAELANKKAARNGRAAKDSKFSPEAEDFSPFPLRDDVVSHWIARGLLKKA